MTHLEQIAHNLVTEARRLANDDPNRIDLADVMPFLEASVGVQQAEAIDAMRKLVEQQDEALLISQTEKDAREIAEAEHKESENDRRRDYIAVYAMQGLLAARSGLPEQIIAEGAYNLANAMLAEREKRLAFAVPASKTKLSE